MTTHAIRGHTRVFPWVMIAGAMACAVAAVTLSHTQPQQRSLAHLFATAFGVLAACGVLLTSTERAGREVSRRRYFLIAGIGTATVLVGQSIGYLVTMHETGAFDPRVEMIPLLVGMPAATVAAALLVWPRGLHGRELLLVAIDSALGIAALALIWLAAIVPLWVQIGDPGLRGVVAVDQWLLFTGIALVVVLMAASRRLGSLPLPQLLLLLGGVLLWLVSDLLGEFGSDRQASVSASVIGYSIAVIVLMIMGSRSAAEIETPEHTRWRYALSLLLPVVLLFIAGLLVVASAARALGPAGYLTAGLAWLALLSGLTIARVLTFGDVRDGQHREMVQTLSESAAHGWVGTLLRDTAEYVMVLDAQGQIVFSSPRTSAELAEVERFPDLVIDPDAGEVATLLAGVTLGSIEAGPHEMLLRSQDDAVREVEVHLRPIQDISFEGFVVTGVDVTGARRLQRSLDSTRRRDELTGLLTSEAILAEVASALSLNTRDRTSVLCAVLDLSDFGVWNDTLGRNGGDEILCSVAREFEGLPPEVIAVSRQGGDAFGLLMVSASVASTLEQVIEIIRRSFTGMILPSDTEVDLVFRIGYSIASPGEQIDAEQLMDQAGVALRRARKSRQARVVRFQPGMNEDLVNRLAAEVRIREALHNDGVVVYYQPIVSLVDGAVRSVEALARLHTHATGILAPGAFIEAAEHSGLVKDIDRQVRAQVATDWPAIAAMTDQGLRININVSQNELNPDLAEELHAMGLTRRVVVEVTEASLLSDPQTAGRTLD
ncbi:MAG TPA: EAL domain-containing protein, partial [Actinomycetota bacterium]|nr:EAL domain-containing protein [Actinomycetota bacterium]